MAEREVDTELRIRHSRWIDKEAIEDVKVGRVSLRAVDSGPGTRGEAAPDEALHLSWIGEGEGLPRSKSDEDVVGVDVCCSHLRESGVASRGNIGIIG